MQFEVRALRQNQIVSLVVEALNEADARAQALAQAVKPVSVTKLSGASALGRKTKSTFSLLLFTQELLALLDAGLSIVESIDTLLEKERRADVHAVLARIARSFSEGKSFSVALEETGGIFPPLYVGIVRAAESTSNLPEALTRFVEYRVRLDAVRAKVRSALIYPSVLLIVGFSVSLFLIGYVVPRFATVYQGTGRQLPALSAMMLAWGNFAATHTTAMLIGLASLIVAAVFAVRAIIKRGGVAFVLHRIPGLSERVKLYELARLYLTLGMLLDGGLPVVVALQMVEEIVPPTMADSLRGAAEAIRTGESFTSAFERHGLTTSVAVRFLRVGERSAKLGEMLTKSARYYDTEIERWLDWFSRVFEPALMAAIGLVVGGIVILLYMPIFDLAGSLQ